MMDGFFDTIVDVRYQYHTFTYTLSPTLVRTNEGFICPYDIVIFQWWAVYAILLYFIMHEIEHNYRTEGT